MVGRRAVDLRETFGEDAELYDRCRPGYPPQMFVDLAEMTAVGTGCRVLEIGCGTGQATVPLARLGCEITAVEVSHSLAALALRNVAEFDRVRVEIAPFERWTLPQERFDVVVAATAFHWIDPRVRVVKAADALRAGGTIAVMSSHHIAGGTNGFFADVQRCYERFDPATPPGLSLPCAGEVAKDSSEFDRRGRFGPVTFKDYEWEHSYSTSEYLDLLCTYSGHRALSPDAREGLLGCIAHVIDQDHQGRITKRYLTRLAVAQLVW